MTHSDDDHGQNTDVDEHLIWKGPFGIHFDSLEGKWLLVGVATALMIVLTGSIEALAVIGPCALGIRHVKLGKLSALEEQPWWWVSGVMIGFPIAIGVREALHHYGIQTPDVPWLKLVRVVAGF